MAAGLHSPTPSYLELIERFLRYAASVGTSKEAIAQLQAEASTLAIRLEELERHERSKGLMGGQGVGRRQYDEWISDIHSAAIGATPQLTLVRNYMKKVSDVYPVTLPATYPGPWFIVLQGEMQGGNLLSVAGYYQHGFHPESWKTFAEVDLSRATIDPLVVRLLVQQAPAIGWYMPFFWGTYYRGFLGRILEAERRFGDGANFWINAMPLAGEVDRAPMAVIIVYANQGPIHDPKSPPGAHQDARVLDALATGYRQLEHNIKNLAAFVERSRREIIDRLAPGILHHEIGFVVRSLGPQLVEHRDAMKKLTDKYHDPILARELRAVELQMALANRLQEISTTFNRFETRSSVRRRTLAEVLQDADVLLHHRRGEVGVNLSWNANTAKKIVLHTDFTLLVHAIVNILSNAFNAFSDSSDTLSPREVVIESDTASIPGICALEVFNNGPPISDQDAAYIFDPGYTTRLGGHGQGLPLTRKVCKYLGGDVVLLESARIPKGMRVGFQLTFAMHLSTEEGLARELIK